MHGHGSILNAFGNVFNACIAIFTVIYIFLRCIVIWNSFCFAWRVLYDYKVMENNLPSMNLTVQWKTTLNIE